MNAPADLPDLLRQLADLSDVRGASLEAHDLRRAAAAVDSLGPDGTARLTRLARRGRLHLHDAIVPPDTEWRIREILAEGAQEVLRRARTSLPALFRHLLDAAAIDAAEARALARLDVLTLSDLELALHDGRARSALSHAGASRLDALLPSLLEQRETMVLGRAWDLLESLLTLLAGASPPLPLFEPAGDVRRSEPFVTGIVLVAASESPARVLEAVCALLESGTFHHRGSSRAIVGFRGTEVDFRISEPVARGTVLFVATGANRHVAAVLGRNPSQDPCPSEADLYARAGLVFVPPELRDGSDEIEAAARGTLPSLVNRTDIHGDLHMHTTYSDGRDSVAAMVRECVSLGYEYLAITDHSQSAAASRTLGRDDIARQRDEIDRARQAFPQIRILHGVEVDILCDGRLDFPDRLLERFDIVLASLHERCGHDGRRLTSRCLGALRHPLVTIFTHPLNRIPGQRGPYPLDFERVFEVAAETATALEVDGAPGHLDLDGAHARLAVRAGATLAVDSDCHRARSLERQMRLGVGTARRGWVEPVHVLNARPLDEVLAFIARKRNPSPTEP
ncbi:MAG TPA: PHP domain-containing protein [Vicinamibacterales bacterium]|nr:PHP domain-containing protein [Vicinamibacterales bacterium]